jgi:phthiodiolone/phenolphthiodiolone dimycocerosates ketoreductase
MVAETSYRTARVTGADSYWLADHLTSVMPRAVMTPKYNGIARLVPDVDAFLEPWTTLGALAGRRRFSRMQLGTCVTDTGRRNPAVTAQAAATLHLMTRGRAILGIGTGERVGNEPYGVDWSKPVARFEEGLATIRAHCTFAGPPPPSAAVSTLADYKKGTQIRAGSARLTVQRHHVSGVGLRRRQGP